MKTLVFDTETISLKDKRCFDIGWTIGDIETGKVLDRKSFLVEGMFDTEVYKTAHYYEQNDKVYRDLLLTGLIEIVPMLEIRRQMNLDIVKYEVKSIAAFNIKFDIAAFNATVSYARTLDTEFNPEELDKLYSEVSLDKWKRRFTVIDIPIIFCHTTNIQDYIKFCREKKLLTEKGYISTKVDSINKYLISEDYIESHTAEKDSYDEFYILHKAWQKRKESWKSEIRDPWRILAALSK